MMAHYAKIENNIVTQVIVAEQEFIDSGAVGDPSSWIQTSYNGNIRGRFAGIGYLYMPEHDIFIAPKPFPSWTFDEAVLTWKAPKDKPEGNYIWNEDTKDWDEAPNILPGG